MAAYMIVTDGLSTHILDFQPLAGLWENAVLEETCETTCRLEEMEWLMTRETIRDTPQYYIMSMSGSGAKPGLRQLSDYPHPYPSLKDLQKEIIRCRTHPQSG